MEGFVKTSKGMLWLALLGSLVVHALLVWCFVRYEQQMLRAQPIEVFVTDEAMRIIDLVQPANRIRPPKAKVVGIEHNTTTEETVARNQPAPMPRTDRAPHATPSAPPSRASSSLSPPHAMREPRATPRPARLPSTAVSEELGLGAVTHLPEDYFPDYKHGGRTYLNVLKRPGVDYFVQLKRTFKTAWNPIPALRAHVTANEVSRGGVRVVVGVSVDRAGELSELFVLKGSGLARYDQEAVHAIKISAPFTSPPPKLLAADGMLHMSWTFIVYL